MMVEAEFWNMLSQYGALGLLIAMMFWFMRYHLREMEKVMEKNTQAFQELRNEMQNLSAIIGAFRETMHEQNKRFEFMLNYILEEMKNRKKT
jgi:hypothetical protein